MKIIQSFWSKPSFHSMQNYNNARRFGGWLNFRYFMISTALSCLSIRKHQGKIELVTDDNGKGLFVDLMELPYDNVSLALNELANEDHKLWILGKMKAIRMQNEPFIHMDNDIYLWESLPSSASADFMITQSRFPIWAEYRASLNELLAHFSYVPDCLRERPTESTMVANVGIIGGNDIGFFQEFCDVSERMLEENRDRIALLNDIGGFNQMMEEYLFTSIVRSQRREMLYYMEANRHPVFPPSHLNFNLVPVVYKYIHLIGKNKQNRFACEQLELRLKYEYPHEYKKINDVIAGLDDQTTVEDLTDRQEKLVKALDVFYNSSFEEIANRKIRVVPGMEIIRVKDFLGDEINYAVRENEQSNSLKSLPSFACEEMDSWLHLFDTPMSINETWERMAQSTTQSTDQHVMSIHKYRMINSLTSNILLTGIMEFVE